jgi:hypothetical protein
MIVHANILHHGAEMFMKAVLARNDNCGADSRVRAPETGYHFETRTQEIKTEGQALLISQQKIVQRR